MFICTKCELHKLPLNTLFKNVIILLDDMEGMLMRNELCKLDKKTFNLVMLFEKISFLISLIGIIALYIYWKYYIDIDLYYVSIIIFRTGLLAGICSFCFGIFFNGLNNGLIHK